MNSSKFDQKSISLSSFLRTADFKSRIRALYVLTGIVARSNTRKIQKIKQDTCYTYRTILELVRPQIIKFPFVRTYDILLGYSNS